MDGERCEKYFDKCREEGRQSRPDEGPRNVLTRSVEKRLANAFLPLPGTSLAIPFHQ